MFGTKYGVEYAAKHTLLLTHADFFFIYFFLIKKNIKKDTVAINLICNDVMKIRDYNLNFITIKSLDWSQV